MLSANGRALAAWWAALGVAAAQTTCSSPPTTTASCDAGWTAYGDTCYALADSGVGFDSCANECAARGASLPCVDGPCVNEFLTGEFGPNSRGERPDGGIWVGLYQRPGTKETEVHWDRWAADGCAAVDTGFRPWYASHPDDKSCVQEACAVLWSTGPGGGWHETWHNRWYDWVCNEGAVHGIECVCGDIECA